jgi:hypothetical protein
VTWHQAIGASLEILFRSPRTLYALHLYTPPNDPNSGYRITSATLVGANGSQREINFRGLNEWEEITFSTLEGDTFRFEVNEIRRGGASSLMEVNEVRLIGK